MTDGKALYMETLSILAWCTSNCTFFFYIAKRHIIKVNPPFDKKESFCFFLIAFLSWQKICWFLGRIFFLFWKTANIVTELIPLQVYPFHLFHCKILYTKVQISTHSQCATVCNVRCKCLLPLKIFSGKIANNVKLRRRNFGNIFQISGDLPVHPCSLHSL